MKKRILSAALTLVLTFGLLPTVVWAESSLEQDGANSIWMAWVDWNNGSATIQNEKESLRTQWEIGASPALAFYYGINSDSAAVVSEVVASDPQIINVQKENAGNTTFWCLNFVSEGECTLTFTIGNQDCSATIAVVLPRYGFYTSQERSAETLITGTMDEQTQTMVYLLTSDGIMESEKANYSVVAKPWSTNSETALESFEWIKRSDNKYDLKIALPEVGTFNDGYNIFVKYRNGDGMTCVMSSLPVQAKHTEAEQVLYTCVDIIDGKYQIIGNSATLGSEWWMDTSWQGVFSYDTGDSVERVTKIEVVSGNGIEVTEKHANTVDGGVFWRLHTTAIGKTVLRFTAGENSYDMTVTVVLPEYGFYTQHDRDAEYLVYDANYIDCKTLYAMCEKGFTRDQSEHFRVIALWRNDGGEPISEELTENITWLPRDDGNYDLKIDLPKMADIDDDYVIEVLDEETVVCSCGVMVIGKNIDTGDSTVGPISIDAMTNVISLRSSIWMTFGSETIALPAVNLDVQALLSDGEKYKIDSDITVEITDIQIIPLSDDYALNTPEVKRNDDGKWTLQPQLAPFDGILRYGVDITAGGKVRSDTVDQLVCVRRIDDVELEARPADDTAEKLNDYLKKLAERVDGQDGVNYILQLAPVSYEGTISIPAELTDYISQNSMLILKGAESENGKNTTQIKGGIREEINSRGYRVQIKSISNIDFVGTDYTDSALNNVECADIFCCSFTGYQVALRSDANNSPRPQKCLFYDNNIAYQVSIDANYEGNSVGASVLEKNLFLRNRIAVQALRFGEAWSSAYYFRIKDSNFINNGCDFDMQTNGTVYLYRNFYGTMSNEAENAFLNGFGIQKEMGAETLLTAVYAQPKIDKTGGGHVITNPRWLLPKLWDATPNLLIVDWLNEIRILNTEADELIIDKKAFEEATSRNVEVLDDQEQTIGAWTFN